MVKNLLNCKFHLRFVLNPLIRYKADNLGSISGVNQIKREVPVVVSLTSYEERFDDLVISLYSLLNQSLKPDRIILWLNKSIDSLTNIPYEITKYIKNGLEIRFVDDIGSYTKAIYAFKEYPDSIIVTADDDIFYPKNWLKYLYLSYISCPEDVHCHRAHRIRLKDGKILPYETWIKHIDEENAKYENFLTGTGGVLYPPNCFTNEVLREDIFLKYAPSADDIWFWVMALVHKRKVRIVKNHYKTLICTNLCRQLWGQTLFSKNRKGENDRQLKNLMKFYKQNIDMMLFN